MEKNKLERM